ANDAIDDRRGKENHEARQNEVPELLPANAACHVEIMLGDVAAEVFDDDLRIHGRSPSIRLRRIGAAPDSRVENQLIPCIKPSQCWPITQAGHKQRAWFPGFS